MFEMLQMICNTVVALLSLSAAATCSPCQSSKLLLLLLLLLPLLLASMLPLSVKQARTVTIHQQSPYNNHYRVSPLC